MLIFCQSIFIYFTESEPGVAEAATWGAVSETYLQRMVFSHLKYKMFFCFFTVVAYYLSSYAVFSACGFVLSLYTPVNE